MRARKNLMVDLGFIAVWCSEAGIDILKAIDLTAGILGVGLVFFRGIVMIEINLSEKAKERLQQMLSFDEQKSVRLVFKGIG